MTAIEKVEAVDSRTVEIIAAASSLQPKIECCESKIALKSTDASADSETAILPLGIRNNEISQSDFDILEQMAKEMKDQPIPAPPRRVREGKRAKTRA